MEILHYTVLTVLTLCALLWLLMILAALAQRRDRRFVLNTGDGEVQGEPHVSILIPARNEAGVIGHAVAAALAQDWPRLELRVIDDNSTDGTGQEARDAAKGDPRFHLHSGTPLPTGWKGKPWALWQLQQHATGDLLLFVDADVRLATSAVRDVVAALQQRDLELLSAWGTWTLDGFWIKVALPVVGGFVRGAHPLDRVNDPKDDAVFANGQLILITRDAYDRMGGHQTVRDEVLEDVRIAQAARRTGLRAGMFLAPDLFRVRLYTTLDELWHGTVKNFWAGMNSRLGVALAAAAFIGFTALLPPLTLIAGIVLCDPRWIAPSAACWGLMTTFRLVQRTPGEPPWAALLHPLGAAILFGVVTLSAWRGLTGRTTRWKDRPV